MTKNPQTPIAILLCAAMLFVPALAPAQQPAASVSALRIVVIAGEEAINIIQQKTAVNPIVEVRDRNNLPVSGVAVTFSVGGQGASFAGGASTLTLTTNAAGQAVVTGLTPTATGAVTINATAVVNGQTIAATITQTNFATAAEAAQAAASAGSASGGGSGAGSGSGSGAGGGSGAGTGTGAGAGGGLSGTTLGIVGGAVAAGGLVASQAGGGGDDSSSSTSTGTSTTGTGTSTTGTGTTSSTAGTYNGTFSGTFTSTGSSSTPGFTGISCTSTYAVTGTIRIVLNSTTDGSVSGTGDATPSFRETATTCTTPGLDLSPDGSVVTMPFTGPVTGTSSSLRFTQDTTQNQNVQGATVSSRFTQTFTGSLSGNSITGTVTMTSSSSVIISGDGFTITGTGTGTGTMPATLTR